MLTLVPPSTTPWRSDEERALLDMVKQLRRFDWDRFLLGWCAAFHLLAAVVIFAFPLEQVQTAGTRPVLDLAPRQVWAGAFLVAGAAVALLPRRNVAAVRVAVWVAVLFLGGVWLTAFCWAALRGEGSAVGLVAWPFLYGPWAIVAYRLSSGKR